MTPRKPPEAFPEAHPEDPGTTWIKIPEAAALLGMSERAARDWVKRYAIPQRGERPVLVSEAALRKQLAEMGKAPEGTPEVPGRPPEGPGGGAEPIDVPYRVSDGTDRILVPLDRMVEQVQGLSDQLGHLAARNETLALEVGTLRERTVTQEHTISRLASERDALRRRVDELTAPTPPPPPPAPAGLPQRSWWRFWESRSPTP